MKEIYHELSVVIRPATDARSSIEDDLKASFRERGRGELVVGTGAATDGSFCNLDMAVADLASGLQVVREVLIRHRVPRTTTIDHHGPNVVEYAVYE